MGKVLCMFKGEKHMSRIFDVADFFLCKGKGSISPLKLQKLVYYAQAWSLTWDEKPLFDSEFQAWRHGPANYELYKKYENYYRNECIHVEDVKVKIDKFTCEELDTLESVWRSYGHYTGEELENLTHQESPWVDTREGLNEFEGCNRIITKESMKRYYSKF